MIDEKRQWDARLSDNCCCLQTEYKFVWSVSPCIKATKHKRITEVKAAGLGRHTTQNQTHRDIVAASIWSFSQGDLVIGDIWCKQLKSKKWNALKQHQALVGLNYSRLGHKKKHNIVSGLLLSKRSSVFTYKNCSGNICVCLSICSTFKRIFAG